MPSHCYLVLLAFFLPVVVASTEKLYLIGTWTPLNTSDPRAIRVAECAVTEYNKNAIKKLVFERLVSGRKVFASGAYYEIVIAAKNATLPDPPSNYLASVWVQFMKTRLRGFEKVKTHDTE
uniref:cysteine proteinase inhibitor 5-like n=1 Tax=Fragaria vesca subsp. vesca TaxID=101020 RepID=UPI0005C80FA5|nr:PREDICTED: cysteine proteinase inhibitor 5-like [Fragaria vesca subsp. vesca]